MGLAHVLDDLMGNIIGADLYRHILAVVAIVKAIDTAQAGGTVVAVPLGLAGVALLVVRRDDWAATVALGALLVCLSAWYRNHLALLMWLSLTVAIFPPGSQRRYILRWQLSIVYGFATVAKIWPDWLRGAVLEERSWLARDLPGAGVQLLVWGTILVEGALAIGVWRTERIWVWLALATHVSFAVFLLPDPWDIVRLIVFGTLMLATWFHSRPDPSPASNAGVASFLTRSRSVS